MVEVAYVGTKGRDLVSRTNGNVMPYGVMSQGTFNGVDLSVPINRVAVASISDNLASFRPFNALKAITLYDFRGTSDYNSMQVTLSRQTGKRLQYFVAYTFGKTQGHARRRDYSNHRSVRSEPHLRRPQHGPHPHPERLVERVPA